MGKNVNIYFSDFFAVDKGILEQEGIFDISLIKLTKITNHAKKFF